MRMVPLGEVAEVVSGATPKTGVAEYWGGGVQWATPADLSALSGPYIAETPRSLTDEGVRNCATNILPANSVLLSSRAPIGYVAINAVPMATNQGFKSLVPHQELNAKYLYHWLRSKTGYLQSLGNGATFKELSKRTVEKVRVPLPPLEEQRRIAAILDKADSIRAKRRQALDHLDSLTQSIFHDMFGDPASWRTRWKMRTIGDLAKSVDYGTSARSGSSGAAPVLRMGNLTDSGRLDLTDLKYMDLDSSETDRYTIKRGDLLFNRTNSLDKVGKAAVVRSDFQAAYAGYLVRVRFASSDCAEFVSAYLRSAHGKATRRRLAKAAVNQANISASQMRNIEVADPPSNLVASFANRLTAVERQRAKLVGSSKADDQLFASLQSRAFKGEL